MSSSPSSILQRVVSFTLASENHQQSTQASKEEKARVGETWKVVGQETRVIWSRSTDIKKLKKKKIKGTSLLAKPTKAKAKKPILNGSRVCPALFSSYFYRNHDYCSNPNKLMLANAANSMVECASLLEKSDSNNSSTQSLIVSSSELEERKAVASIINSSSENEDYINNKEESPLRV